MDLASGSACMRSGSNPSDRRIQAAQGGKRIKVHARDAKQKR
jgi:hypothetical protein